MRTHSPWINPPGDVVSVAERASRSRWDIGCRTAARFIYVVVFLARERVGNSGTQISNPLTTTTDRLPVHRGGILMSAGPGPPKEEATGRVRGKQKRQRREKRGRGVWYRRLLPPAMDRGLMVAGHNSSPLWARHQLLLAKKAQQCPPGHAGRSWRDSGGEKHHILQPIEDRVWEWRSSRYRARRSPTRWMVRDGLLPTDERVPGVAGA